MPEPAENLPAPRLPLPGLDRHLKAMNWELLPIQLRDLEQFAGWLVAANKKVNLTAITRPEDIETKHLADSLAVSFVDRWAERRRG